MTVGSFENNSTLENMSGGPLEWEGGECGYSSE